MKRLYGLVFALFLCSLAFTIQPAEAGPCPPPRNYSGGCIQVITYATNPATGECCVYPDPCSAPNGWTLNYSGCGTAG